MSTAADPPANADHGGAADLEVLERERRPSAAGLALALLPMLVAVSAALLGPVDLDENDQAKQALCILDVWERGNWILPLERGVLPATKPPLFAWLAAACSLPFGGPTPLSCRLPSAAAALLLAAVGYALACERWGNRVGIAAGWLLGASPFVAVITHVRPDAVLSLLVATSLFALHRIEAGRPRGMAWLYWCSVSLSALAKGPIGPLLASVPLALLAWRPAGDRARWRVLLHPWALSTLTLPLVWFALALTIGGMDWLTGTVLNETVERALGTGARAGKTHPPGYLLLHFLGKWAPWSALALIGAARAFRAGADARLRLLAVWLLTGLVLLNLSRGQRWVYVMPLLPCAACLAAATIEASERARLLFRVATALATAAALVLAALLVALPGWSLLSGAVAVGPWLPACLGLAGLLGAAALGLERRARGVSLGALVAACLVVNVGYASVLSTAARSERGRVTAAFAEEVLARVGPADRLVLYGDWLGYALHFLLRHNEASITREELSLLDLRPTRPGGRVLLVAATGYEADLESCLPGRFRPVLIRPHRDDRPGLVLYEVVQPGHEQPSTPR